jgi:DNA processing protein
MAGTLGSVAAIPEATEPELMDAGGIGRELAAAVYAGIRDVDWRSEIARAEADGVSIVTQADDQYPKPLRSIHDPPLALYLKGALQCRDDRALAIVGTRRATHYGRDTARRLAAGIAKAGYTIVSGLALGIDTAAHEGALDGGGRTIGVIAGVLDCFYPPSNAELAGRMALHGAVITEYPYGRQPDRATFPVRNRIVSGLSMGVILVEGTPQSGGMITVSLAAEQGRQVFAVPGRVDAPGSGGPHSLIRDGAKLTASVDDVLEEFESLFPGRAGTDGVSAPPRHGLSPAECRLLDSVEEGCDSVDGLIRSTGMTASEVTSKLICLEMKRRIRMRPGQRVELAFRE